LEGYEKGFVKGVKGKSTSSKAIKLQKKYPGREFAFDIPDLEGKGKGRVYIVGDRLYQVTALGTEDFMSSDDIDVFFNSFKLTGSGGSQPEPKKKKDKDKDQPSPVAAPGPARSR